LSPSHPGLHVDPENPLVQRSPGSQSDFERQLSPGPPCMQPGSSRADPAIKMAARNFLEEVMGHQESNGRAAAISSKTARLFTVSELARGKPFTARIH